MKNAIKKFATISMAFTLLGTGAAFFGNNTLTASAATTTSSQWVSSTIEIVRTYKNGKLVSTKTIYHKPTVTPIISTPAVNMTTNTEVQQSSQLDEKHQRAETANKALDFIGAIGDICDPLSPIKSPVSKYGSTINAAKEIVNESTKKTDEYDRIMKEVGLQNE